MTERENNERMAAMFLKEVYRRANHYADRLDPDTKRNYERDPLLKALDAVLGPVVHALYVRNPRWMAEDWSGERATPKQDDGGDRG